MKSLLNMILTGLLLWSMQTMHAGTPPPVDQVKQGFSMRMWLDNRGVFGREAFPGITPIYPGDSIGLEYPIGSGVEHLWGAGIWVGGLLDTSSAGGQPPLKLVTSSYNNDAANFLFETFPGNDVADTIWETSLRDTVAPPGWDDYWEGIIPFALYLTKTST